MYTDDSHFRVLVVAPQTSAAGRMKLNGINRFLNEGHDWDMELVRSEAGLSADTFEGLGRKDFDGIFSGWLETPQIRRAREATGLPSVHFGGSGETAADSPDALCILFHDDTRAIIRAACRHFGAIGRIVAFAFVPSRNKTFWSDEREKEFVAEAARLKTDCRVFKGGDLAGWLESLPKPAGVLCAFDDRAADVLAACRRAKIAVPDDISVMGVGDDALVCERVKPRLSSVAVDYEEQGYRAARELHAMMLRSRRPRETEIATGAARVVARASTQRESPSASLVRRAADFIAERATDGIEPPDVVRHVRASRRLLDLKFKELTGKTLREAIREKRLAAVKTMLETTDRRISEIAGACGYKDANYLKNQFKKQFGLSMRDWRATRTAPPGGIPGRRRNPTQSARFLV